MPTRDAPQAFKMRVYFPKYVTINNRPLFVLYWLVSIITVGIAIYQFVAGKRYEIQKLPEGEISLCSQFCPAVDPSIASTPSYCQSTNDFGVGYNGVQCAPPCSSVQGQGTSTCMTQGEAMQYSTTTVFIPTFFKETKVKNPTYLTGNCDPGYTYLYDGKVCHSEGNYFVQGVEDQYIEFSHKYVVSKPTSSIFGDQPDISGDSLTDTDTIILGRDGEKKQTISAGSKIRFKISKLLELAGLDECCDKDIGDALDMDAGYERSEGGVQKLQSGSTSPTPRLTGVTITIDLDYTNEGGCRLSLQHNTVGLDGTAACLSVRARRQWSQSTSKGYALDASTTTPEQQQFQRDYSGILINFHIHGSFKFIDGSAFFRGMTTILIWMGIPVWILYFFAILFLGKLSTIYSRVIHQELSLASACVGLAGRLISHTSAFADVQDFPEGLSKKRLHERFQMIMQFSRDLDDTEVRKFVDFVYDGVSIAAGDGGPADDELIDVQDFCTVCSTNESLTFDSLVKIFDRDRRLGSFESFFQDDVIEQARSVAANDNMAEAVKHALVKTEKGLKSGASFTRAGAFNPIMLEQRFQMVEEEINKIQTEINKTLLKEKNLVKQVEHAEQKVKELGGSLEYS